MYCGAGQATGDNMAHAHCVPHNYGYTRTLTVRNICCFSTVTMVARTQLIVTVYLHCYSVLALPVSVYMQCTQNINKLLYLVGFQPFYKPQRPLG